MEQIIPIIELNLDAQNFLDMPNGVKKNLFYQRNIQGNSYSRANVLIREDGTVHYSFSLYKIKKGDKAYFIKKDKQQGFTVDPKGKMKLWFGEKLCTIPNLMEVLNVLKREWVKPEYLQFITSSIMGKVIIGKITNPHDLFSAILKMYRVNASPYKFRQAVEKKALTKSALLHGIASAKNLDHYFDFLINNNGLGYGDHIDLIQQAFVLERKIDYTWSKNRIAEEHKKWTKELMDLESDSMDREPLEWLQEFKKYNNDKFTLLETEHDVFLEGKVMNHCVYTNYWSAVKNGNFVVFHINDGSEYGCTLGLNYNKHTGLVFNQLHGRYNSRCSSEVKEKVTQWLKSVNPNADTKVLEYDFAI